MKSKTVFIVFMSIASLIALAILGEVVVWFTSDSIALTLPPWDYCGFNANHIGKAFTCIAFDSDVVIIK